MGLMRIKKSTKLSNKLRSISTKVLIRCEDVIDRIREYGVKDTPMIGMEGYILEEKEWYLVRVSINYLLILFKTKEDLIVAVDLIAKSNLDISFQTYQEVLKSEGWI